MIKNVTCTAEAEFITLLLSLVATFHSIVLSIVPPNFTEQNDTHPFFLIPLRTYLLVCYATLEGASVAPSCLPTNQVLSSTGTIQSVPITIGHANMEYKSTHF